MLCIPVMTTPVSHDPSDIYLKQISAYIHTVNNVTNCIELNTVLLYFKFMPFQHRHYHAFVIIIKCSIMDKK